MFELLGHKDHYLCEMSVLDDTTSHLCTGSCYILILHFSFCPIPIKDRSKNYLHRVLNFILWEFSLTPTK